MKQYRAVATWEVSPLIGKTRVASSMWYSNKSEAERIGRSMTGNVTIAERDYAAAVMPCMVTT